LQKVLAQSGLGSRRGLEDRILQGEVLINGEPASVGQTVVAGDRIAVDGKAFVVRRQEGEYGRVLLYNKPEGEVSTRSDPEGRPTVFDRLPRIKGQRWIAIGRLDLNTQGLLVFTTNGALADQLMHPSNEVEREYLCRVHGEASDAQLQQLVDGVELEDGPARFEELEAISDEELDGSNRWFRVVLKEGRQREVRRLWQAAGLEVSRLKRIRFGTFTLSKAIRRGEVQELERAEVDALCRELGVPLPGPVLVAVDPRLRRSRDEEGGEAKPRRYKVVGEKPPREAMGRMRPESIFDDRPERPGPRGKGKPGGFRPGGRPAQPGRGPREDVRFPSDVQRSREDRGGFPGDGRAPGPGRAGPGGRGPGGAGARGPGGPGRGPAGGAPGRGGPGARGPGGPGSRGPGGPGRGPGGPGRGPMGAGPAREGGGRGPGGPGRGPMGAGPGREGGGRSPAGPGRGPMGGPGRGGPGGPGPRGPGGFQGRGAPQGRGPGRGAPDRGPPGGMPGMDRERAPRGLPGMHDDDDF
jgi:23S rRNA pseudouridine2605 synthase